VDSPLTIPKMRKPETVEELQEVGRQRLYPSLRDPNWLILRRRRQLFQAWLTGLPTHAPSVLDVGGRIQPYRPLIPAKPERYVAVDLLPTALVNVIARGEQLPLASESFDLTFCTQMLEYPPEPARVIAEIYRVLKPGGVLLLSVPSLSMRHLGETCWRFWPTGIRHLLAGFSEVEVVPEGGSIAGFFRTMNSGMQLFAKYPLIRAVLGFTVIPFLNLTGFALENLAHSDNDVFTANYSVFARK